MKEIELGVMLDCARNAVPTVEHIKKFATTVARMGYSKLYLYLEDVYRIEGEPYFGYMRGRYSVEELQEVDRYCDFLGIEVIPCIQTLAHLDSIVRWKKYREFTDLKNILLVGDERTYELIDKMFATMKKAFKTDKINIGCDEAVSLGRGRYLDEHGYRPPHEILAEHINRVYEIGRKYSYKMMTWSDMFFAASNGGKYSAEGVDENIFSTLANSVPSDITQCYWSYYGKDEKEYDKTFAIHKKYFKNVLFVGGAISWYGFAPCNTHSVEILKAGIKSALANGITQVMITLWKDSGGQCSDFSLLPSLFAAAEFSRGNFSAEVIKQKFYDEFKISFDDFSLLDTPNFVGDNYKQKTTTPSYYMLYNDFFGGPFDCFVKKGDGARYATYAKKLLSVKSGDYRYIFKTEALLCAVLAEKYEIGVLTREAYQKNDAATLEKLIDRYKLIAKRVRKLADAFNDFWKTDYKSVGSEVEDIKLGGLARRAEHCAEMLKNFVTCGEKIAELEEPVLDFYGNGTAITGEPVVCYQYELCASVNRILI